MTKQNDMMDTSQDQKNDQKLDQAIQSLNNEMTPPKDLWQGIDLAIESGRTISPKRKTPLLSLAAGVCMLVLAGWLVTLQHEQTPAVVQQPSATSIIEGYEQKKLALLTAYEDTRPLSNNWQEQLAELEAAADAIKKALKEDQNNGPLLKMLQQVYQQQVDLIKQVHQSPWKEI